MKRRQGPAAVKRASRRIPVYVVLPPRLLLLDVAGPVEVLRRANQVQSAVQFEVHYVAASASLHSSIGLTVSGLQALPPRLPEGAWVLVAGDVDEIQFGGGENPRPSAEDRAQEQVLVDWLRMTVTPAQRLICICSGALNAARAGLLDGHACTTHHACCEELTRLAPRARVLDNRLYVEDGNTCTSAGITTGIDLLLHLVSQCTERSVALDVARYLVVYLRRSGADPQLSPWLEGRNHLHPAVHRVQDAVAADVARAWSVTQLARIAGVSSRHLSRLFREHVGMSIVDYANRLRVALAQELLSQTRLDMEHVAERAGFSSSRQLRRAWRRVHDSAPRSVRLPGSAAES